MNNSITSSTCTLMTGSPASNMNGGSEADSHSPFSIMNNIWLTTGIISFVGIVVLLVVLIKWSNSVGHKLVDQRICGMIADPLSNKLGVTTKDITSSLLSEAGYSGLKTRLREIVGSIKVTATKTRIGHPVEMSVVLNYKDGTSYSAKSGIMWEDLPGEIREALIRSESNTIDYLWSLPR